MDDVIAGRFEKARVKHIAVHKKEPLALIAIYNGDFELWNTVSMSLVKSGSIGEIPLRACAFLEEADAFLLGSDDGMLRLYSLDAFELKHTITAHRDFIRGLAVHPTLPYVASSSDDNTIKLWDYSKGLTPIRTLTGHTHFVMSIDFSLRDSRLLLSVGLDHNARLWNIETGVSTILEDPKSALNACAFVADRFAVAGGDDGRLHIWDTTTHALITSVAAHNGPITGIAKSIGQFVTAGEDGAVREWPGTRFRPQAPTAARLRRLWTVACGAPGSLLAGGDEGLAFVRRPAPAPLFSFMGIGNSNYLRTGPSAARMVIVEDSTLKQVRVGGSGSMPDITANDAVSISAGPAKVLTTLSYIPERVAISTSGRYLAVESEETVHIHTLLGFLLQISVPGTHPIWTGPEDFIVVHAGRVEQYTEFVLVGAVDTGLDEPIRAIQSMSYGDWLISTESGRSYIMGDEGCLVDQTDDAIGAHLHGDVQVLIWPRRIEMRMLNERVQCPIKVNSWCAEKGALFISTGMEIVYFAIPEDILPKVLRPTELTGAPTRGVLMGVTDRLWVINGGKIEGIKVPWDLLEFEAAALDGACISDLPTGYEAAAVRFLVGQGRLEAALALSNDSTQRYELLVQMGRLEEAEAAATSGAERARLADLYVAQGKLKRAAKVAAESGVLTSDTLLLAALCNDEEMLSKTAQEAAKAGRTLEALAGAYRAGDENLCRQLLVGTPFIELFDRTRASAGPISTKRS
ncbi:coatomer subunit beta' [Nematocida homosporus]|uniref:coatomer subunit beta' n=1 Tax=Nematocida homosporus TaxID=1912981 RepID=UPI00221EF8D3|nr:coatomer subunit beta' [Nematocida homosporus]KAI5185402.1 coatomer subunit beta' [Nematocida homosporus]